MVGYDRDRGSATHLCVPEVRPKIVAALAELEGYDLAHCASQSLDSITAESIARFSGLCLHGCECNRRCVVGGPKLFAPHASARLRATVITSCHNLEGTNHS